MNSVIIFGGDHHNTLAVIRCFGKQRCNIKRIILHSDSDKKTNIKVKKSKYCNKNNVVVLLENEQMIINFLMNEIDEMNKIVLFPCSDYAEYIIDSNYTLLSSHYIIPGFSNQPNKVCGLMDKWNQYAFAIDNNIPMAKTWKLSLLKNNFDIPNDIVYPCIVKPEISALGHKDDIRICQSYEELNCTLMLLSEKKYTSLIIQEFIEKEYEVCAFGCLIKKHPLINDELKLIGGVIKKLREFPPKGGGSLTYATFINDSRINQLLRKILTILHNNGYNGMYDIELLICKDEIYLNEINFRHSGNGYALVENGVYAPYIWYLDSIGETFNDNLKTYVDEGECFMDELSDFHHRRANNISLFNWIKDIKKASAFAIYSKSDKIGSIKYYFSAIFNYIRRK